jgi:hypothetical protein
MVKYLVTTRLEVLEANKEGCQVFMVDGTVPGWRPTQDDDFWFDHHREGGADVQIDEMSKTFNSSHNFITANAVDSNIPLIVTTQVDADACVAAAWLQLSKNDLYGNEPEFEDADQRMDEVIDKLRAIAYDCDHLGVPSELSHLSDFAAQCVAAMKSDSDKLISELGLSKNRKEWNIEEKEKYASLAFQRGTEALISACKGERKFPGELGEAKEYWEKVEENTQLLLNENRVTFYRDTLLINYRGLQGNYIDPRCALKAYSLMGYECEYPITLAQREVYVNNEYKGFSYTLGCIPLHPLLKDLDYAKGVFSKLTEQELFKNLDHFDNAIPEELKEWYDCIKEESYHLESLEKVVKFLDENKLGWGGRKIVGGSSWNTPSRLTPQEVIDVVLDYH